MIILQGVSATEDFVGHGTFVASQINGYLEGYENSSLATGVHPDIEVIPIKADAILLVINTTGYDNITAYLESNATKFVQAGIFDDMSLEDAANYVANLAMKDGRLKVVNMSLGGWADKYTLYTECANIIYPMIYAGLQVVVAAGNEGLNITEENLNGLYEFPANCRGVIPVSALDSTGNALASFSNYGDVIKFAAPGDMNLGVYPANSYIPQLERYLNLSFTYSDGNLVLTKDSGTSYASPIVAASIAVALASGTKDPVGALGEHHVRFGQSRVRSVHRLRRAKRREGGLRVLEFVDKFECQSISADKYDHYQ